MLVRGTNVRFCLAEAGVCPGRKADIETFRYGYFKTDVGDGYEDIVWAGADSA